MKSLFSRFKAPTNGQGQGGPRQSLDAGTREKDDPDATIRGVTRSRSILRGQRGPTPTSSSGSGGGGNTSERASAAKDLPARPVTPKAGPSRTLTSARAGRSVSERIRAFEIQKDQQAPPPPPPPKDAPRVSLGFRRSSHKPLPTSTTTTDIPEERPSTLVLPDFGADLGDDGGTVADWLQSEHQRSSSENVKKVMFQSPARPATASVTAGGVDSRSRSVSGPEARSGSPAGRAGSPSNNRSNTPTHPYPNAHQRTVSRSSSRASGRLSSTIVRTVCTSGSAAALNSPTKSTMSAVAPSETSTASAQSYFALPESWSAAMDEELIANLGPRERARQEVLWEIVNSEERYVDDLIKLNEAYCKPLLPQNDTALALPDPLDLHRVMSPASSIYPPSLGHDDKQLPIASQYSTQPRMSSESYRPPAGATPVDSSEAADARRNAFDTLTRTGSRPHPTHPPRNHQRSSYHGKDKGHSRMTSRGSITSIMPGPVTLPDDLEQVLTVVASGILEGHLKLIAALRKRYDEQFPLVRSLADVFTTHSDILREYATYILHLERALAQIEETSAMAETIATRGRRSSRRLEETQLGRLSKLISGLEEAALPDGIPGLSISLSKPFQRLLKYPLLFQNLLYNTSPSTKEYEATLAMVDEVQQIVRSIEDEKTSSEDRERARDAWARIEGIERNKALMAPKPTRLLVSETQVMKEERKSHKRLSDLLKGKQEKWIVRFSDVSLLCEIHGTTTVPISTIKTKDGRSDSVTDLTAKRMSNTRRSLKPRNMYRFIKVYEWHERQPKPATPPPRVSLEHFRRTSQDYRRTLGDVSERPYGTAVTQTSIPLKTEDGSSPKRSPRRPGSGSGSGPGSPGPRSPLSTTGDDQSESMSVMSFAFHGDARPKRTHPPRSPPRLAKPTVSSERRSSAKFNRLREEPTIRPGSRTRRSLPPAMVRGTLMPTDGNTERPPWNSSTKPVGGSVGGGGRPASYRERENERNGERNLGGHI